MTSVGRNTYSQFARQLQNYMDAQHLPGPIELYDRLYRVMGKDAPSYSACKAAIKGKGQFPLGVVLFMMESMSFTLKSKHAFPDKNINGEVTKINGQLFLPIRGIHR